MPRLVLLRYSGDVSTKTRGTRAQFVKRLVHNLKDAMASEGFPPVVRVAHDRLFAELPDAAPVDVLTRVFGIQSISPVERRAPEELGAIVRTGVEVFGERVRGRRFAVRARRVGDHGRATVSTRAIERDLGAALLPASAGVDLGSPEVTAAVELFEGEAWFLPERLSAPGGLPLGVEGRALALVSGGFDSAVAAWHLLKRGVSLDYLFCNLGGVTHEQGVLRVIKVVADRWSYGDRPRLFAVDFDAVSRELQAKSEKRYWQVILKRQMLRAAERVARRRRAAALVTGDAVGQVSSQTLRNLAGVSEATRYTILRPLVGFNKDDIIETSRAIGTFELSKVVGEYCALVPRKPATAATLAALHAEERGLDPDVLERAVEERSEFDLRALDLEKLDIPELELAHVPEGTTVLDLRSKAEYASWHYEGALRLDFAQAVDAYPSFDRDQHYLLYCEIGLKSAHLAELMRRAGYDAHHFKGGTRALRRWVEGR